MPPEPCCAKNLWWMVFLICELIISLLNFRCGPVTFNGNPVSADRDSGLRGERSGAGRQRARILQCDAIGDHREGRARRLRIRGPSACAVPVGTRRSRGTYVKRPTLIDVTRTAPSVTPQAPGQPTPTWHFCRYLDTTEPF